jgi:hypothetical protein
MSINQNLEFNILGCNVRIKSDDKNNINAQTAIDLLNTEIESIKRINPSLKDVDVAVLSALKLATKSLEIESEYKENVFALKSGIEDALNFVEQVSPGTMNTNP